MHVRPSHDRRRVGSLSSAHKLLTGSWTSDVEAMETAIGRFKIGKRPSTNDCRIVFFEIPHDAGLHVNVTHSHATKQVAGWSGPADTADGFVHNRVFSDALPAEIMRHIREMVFAART